MSQLQTVVEGMLGSGAFERALLNRQIGFGGGARTYLGATILPERLVASNFYKELGLRYRTVVANDSARYSPPQKKGNAIVGSMQVDLQEQDIAAEMTSEEYDALIEIAKLNGGVENQGNPTMVGEAQMLNWFTNRIILPLVEKSEVQRWQALLDASVQFKSDNNAEDTIPYPNAAGQRVTVAKAWSDPTSDPLADLFAMADRASDKDLTLSRIITSRRNLLLLLAHPSVRTNVGGYVTVDNGALAAGAYRVDQMRLNEWLGLNKLPAIETYDLKYHTQTDTHRFFREDAVCAVCETNRNQTIDLGDAGSLTVQNTLGYVGIGRAAGQPAPGRATVIEFSAKKPPRIDAEGWQTSLPVIAEPEAVFVLNGVSA